MVPHVPVCMYAHVREGDMHLTERVKKKTGTKWDRDQTGRVTRAVRAEETLLAETLAAGPCGDLAFIAGSRGQPMAKKTFSNEFQIACRAAGVPGSAHGVRKIAATRAANAGATVAQLEAIFGWSGGRMVRSIPGLLIVADCRWKQ